MNGSQDLVVLGAGPAGLAAAWRAARRGLKVTLLERADRVGGLAGSFDVAGLRVDHGSHRLHPSTPPRLIADLRSLLGADLQTRPRNGRLRIEGRWIGFPLQAGELARQLPPSMVAKVAQESMTAPFRRAKNDTYAGILKAGLGPTLYNSVYAPYAEKLWGLPGNRISGVQARRRVSADTAWKIAARIVGGSRGDGPGKFFHYPRRGFGQIVEALADAAATAGAEIRLEAEVDSVRVFENEVVVGTQDGDTISAGYAFSTGARPDRPAGTVLGGHRVGDPAAVSCHVVGVCRSSRRSLDAIRCPLHPQPGDADHPDLRARQLSQERGRPHRPLRVVC